MPMTVSSTSRVVVRPSPEDAVQSGRFQTFRVVKKGR